MQLSAQIINRSVAWSALLKPRVGDTVSSNGSYYTNTSGINSAVSDTSNWFKIFSSTSPEPIVKTSGDIAGTGTDFYVDLSADGVPDFPAAKAVYVKIDQNPGTPYVAVDPLLYNPETKRLSGLNNPADFPDQLIKIVML